MKSFYIKFSDISYTGVLKVADYESSIRIWKFKTADSIWQPDHKKNS